MTLTDQNYFTAEKFPNYATQQLSLRLRMEGYVCILT